MNTLDQVLGARLAERQRHHLYRTRQSVDSPCNAQLHIDGRDFLAFCSNDYLGLASHPALAEAACQALAKYGTGSGASHLISGHSTLHHQLEERLAEFTGRPRALLFSTGYMANVGTINALVGQGDLILQDYLNHASLLDGGFISRAEARRFVHADVNALESQLQASTAAQHLVVTDGLFSMDGDLAPLPQYAAAAQRHNAWLMVDDAHGFGVLGANGAGTVEHFGLGIDDVPVLVGTLGKAFGTFGAFVAGSEALIESLIQFARTYIYTTALPPAVAAATLASLKLVQEESWRRDKLCSLIARFRRGAEQIGLQLMSSQTPVQPVLINDDALVVETGRRLREMGILVGAIRPPTVPRGSGRLRITLCANHSEQQIDRLLDALEQTLAVSCTA